ncbi:hypothetical protein [Amycolatopsis sp. FDAARGOS 1241]|uniref:hypothetical protein n=1 Tax=Amycolatopsis sp. FDAARGOS 1241 TaxID=2778070 RepID=UPI00194FA7EC|nr:hypothetical protein [Amycolatopsis sp. FDAARGOS 1241]QRP48860.1 hypothetical protein I6J71_14210 [Amycolatopsis sp. FDAARGOS 1241]
MSDRGYAVTLIIRASNDHHLPPPLDLPEGITATVDGPEVVLEVPVRAPDATTALGAAEDAALDLMMTLASTFSGYEFVRDARRQVRRTDAVYQSDGPPPPFDVVGGGVTEAGAELYDPDGEARRAGRVLNMHLAAVVTHPPAEDVRRFAGRKAWSARLRNGLRLFHAAQNARDEIVKFALIAAALEVLVDADETSLLERLGAEKRQLLGTRLDALLADFDLTKPERERLRDRLQSTRAKGSFQATRDYLGMHDVEIEDGDLRWWVKQRGRYLHTGTFVDEPERRHRLEHAVSACLTAELDRYAPGASPRES